MATPIHPVNSSQISYIGYDAEVNILTIVFKNGSVYQYTDVPKFRFDELHESKSVGKYFADNIKDKYKTTKIK